MAILYTDVALNQRNNLNFPGEPGAATMTTQPGSQNNALFEGPPAVIATYTLTGSEAAGDIINIAVGQAGWYVGVGGRIATGTSAPAAVLTAAVGDNDLNYATARPIPNSQAIQANTQFVQAPLWVANTAYVRGNVVIDAASTPANQTFTCITASVSGSTAPSSDSTNWIPNQRRYAHGLNIAGASANVAFASGTQLYGGPAYAPQTGTLATVNPGGYTTNQALNQPYQLQTDCWLQAVLLTCSTPVAGTVLVFHIGVTAAN